MMLQDYLDLFPSPGNSKPLFMDWESANLKPIVDLQDFLNQIPSDFDLQTAVGVQLDIIGQLIGQPRTVDFTPEGGVSPVMNDDNYRLILLAKILKNNWKGTKQEIYDFWKTYFPKYAILIDDNQDMSMNAIIFGMPISIAGQKIFALGPETDTLKGLGEGYWGGFRKGILAEIVRAGYFVPKPAGVRINYSFVSTPVFGLGPESEFIKGLGTGSWISTS